MRKSWLLFSVLVLALFAVTLVASGPAYAQKKPVVLRLVVPSPAGDWPLTFVNEDLAKRFNARAKGEYTIEVHAGGALAKLPEYFDAVRVGSVEMACAPWGMFTFMDPRLGLIEAPFLVNNNEAGAYAAVRILPLYDQILQEKFNAKGLGLMNLGGIELASTKPVKKMEDWKGLMVAAISPPMAALVKDLGGSPVTIMWTDMYESLQKKVVDAATQGTHGAVVMNIFDVCKHATFFFGIGSWNGFSINLDVWKKMPPNIQKILQEETSASVDWMHKAMAKLDDDDVKFMKQKGVAIYVVPTAEREKWVKAGAATKEKVLSSQGDFGAKIRQITDEANKKFPYKERVVK
jgi:TRAP-type C4-dicarboxylate transport system substrate-binding protein